MEELIILFRKRLSEYRFKRIGMEISLHVNAMDIVLCLAEYALHQNRKITKDELRWFDAGLQLEYVFGGSEWEDLLDYYDSLHQKLLESDLIEK
ncbi:hypothetical protein GCM10009118_07360 [Wandonia haliotis]|uniref:Uncharacterized protein n=1 Tax=Wandonia haliotis TaxID=574963 RepID=A0ABN1MM19_9FLAO